MENNFGAEKWRGRLLRSGYFLAALLLHLVVFLMVATAVIFKAPPQKTDDATFGQVKIAPPPSPPPTPPAPSGGGAANNLEPTAQIVPMPSAPSITTSINPAEFSVKTSSLALPNLPASLADPIGTGLSGHNSGGQGQGNGNPFGTSEANGASLLVGSLFDLKQTRDGKPTGMDPDRFHAVVAQFIGANWDSDSLNHYYKSDKQLSTSHIFIPTLSAGDGPKAFGVEKEVQPNMYLIWYKITASPPTDGTYHFVGIADDILVVRADGRTVLDGCDFAVTDELRNKQKRFDTVNYSPSCEPNGHLWVGTSMHLTAGQQVDIDILIGEEPGGESNYFLFMQREEATYRTQSNGTPLLPIFQVDSSPVHPSGVSGSPPNCPPFSETPEPWQAVSK